MAAYDTLRAAIDNYIKANGNKEITGTVLNDIMNAMVSALGADTRFAGVAVPSTNPGNPEGNVVYFASQAGTYSNFSGIVLPLGIHILVWNGTAWTSQTWFSVDNTPTQNSQNLATSGGILQAIVDAVGVERLRAIGAEVTSCSFDSNTKKISFFNSANTTLFQLDATAFVIDGMVSNVKIEDGNLVIQFNTDAGKQDIEIPLTDIFNPANYYTKTAIDALLALYYTKTETDALLTAINNKLADGCLYRGMAEPTTNPPTPTTKVFYIATKAGTYTNFGNIAVTEGITILKYDGSNWSKEQISYSDGVFDISAYNGTSYVDLSAALGNNGANIPQNLRKGGMSVKFVLTSDNNYIQARLMADSFTTDVTKWQCSTDEVKVGSKDLVESGAVANQFDSLVPIIGGKREQLLSINSSSSAQRTTVDIPAGKVYITNHASTNSLTIAFYNGTTKIAEIASGLSPNVRMELNLPSSADSCLVYNYTGNATTILLDWEVKGSIQQSIEDDEERIDVLEEKVEAFSVDITSNRKYVKGYRDNNTYRTDSNASSWLAYIGGCEKVIVTAGSVDASIALLTSDFLVNRKTFPFANNESMHFIHTNTTQEITIPEDAKYLYVYSSGWGTSYEPSSIVVTKSVEDTLNTSNTELRNIGIEQYLNEQTIALEYNTYKDINIVLEKGDMFEWELVADSPDTILYIDIRGVDYSGNDVKFLEDQWNNGKLRKKVYYAEKNLQKLKALHWDANYEGVANLTVRKLNQSNIENVVYNKLKGKNILYCGTSIPNGSYVPGDRTTTYPNIAAKWLGIKVDNIAMSGAFIRNSKLNGSQFTDGTNDTTSLDYESFSRTDAEYTSILSAMLKSDDSRKYSDAQIANFKTQFGYERILALIDTFDAMVLDFSVNDQGLDYRDIMMFYRYKKYGAEDSEYLSLRALIESYHTVDVDDIINCTTEDRRSYIGAMNYIIKQFLQAKPTMKILIVGHWQLPQFSSQGTGSANDGYIIESQKAVAERWGIPFLNLAEHLGWSNIPLTIDGQSTNIQALRCTDECHPFTDKTGTSTLQIARVLAGFLYDNL